MMKKSTSTQNSRMKENPRSLSPRLAHRNILTSGHLPFGDEEKPEQAPFTGDVP